MEDMIDSFIKIPQVIDYKKSILDDDDNSSYNINSFNDDDLFTMKKQRIIIL